MIHPFSLIASLRRKITQTPCETPEAQLLPQETNASFTTDYACWRPTGQYRHSNPHAIRMHPRKTGHSGTDVVKNLTVNDKYYTTAIKVKQQRMAILSSSQTILGDNGGRPF